MTHSGVMEGIKAFDEEFPDEVAAQFVAVVSLRLVSGEWIANLDVRPGTDEELRHRAEHWAAREVEHLGSGETPSSEWEQRVLPEGVLMMQKYGSTKDLQQS